MGGGEALESDGCECPHPGLCHPSRAWAVQPFPHLCSEDPKSLLCRLLSGLNKKICEKHLLRACFVNIKF